MSKTLTAVVAALALAAIPAAASANNGDPQNCEANPQQPFCQGTPGPTGPQGPAGADGVDGHDGQDGRQGLPGVNGTAGATGATGATPLAVDPGVVIKVVQQPRRAQRCERRFNRAGKLVVVCAKTTCARRESKHGERHIVIACRPKGRKA